MPRHALPSASGSAEEAEEDGERPMPSTGVRGDMPAMTLPSPSMRREKVLLSRPRLAETKPPLGGAAPPVDCACGGGSGVACTLG